MTTMTPSMTAFPWSSVDTAGRKDAGVVKIQVSSDADRSVVDDEHGELTCEPTRPAPVSTKEVPQ